MQIKIAAVLMFLPALSWACAAYDFCRCRNADGSFNDDATKKVCGDKFGYYDKDTPGQTYCIATGVGDGYAGETLYFNNCQWREDCNKHGAMGDSWCWEKEW